MHPSFKRACTRRELELGEVRRVSVGRRVVALFVWNQGVYALEDSCPHAGAPLSQSFADEKGFVSCPEHGWEFDVVTGKQRGGVGCDVDCFEVREHEGAVFVRDPDAAEPER